MKNSYSRVSQIERQPCEFCGKEVNTLKGTAISACLDSGEIHLFGSISEKVQGFIKEKGGKA